MAKKQMANEKKYASLSSLQTFLDNLKDRFVTIENHVVDTELSSTSIHPVQNKVINAEFDAIATAMEVLELSIDSKLGVSDAITNDEIDQICGGTIETYLNSISSEGVGF